jgi:hypothetical protein
MIVLSETTDKIQAVLAGTVATAQLQCVSCWRDITATDYTAGRTVTSTNNTTDVDLVPAPAASTQRVIDFISVRNTDTADQVVTIKYDANGTEYILWKDVLSAGDSVSYGDGRGFTIDRTYQSIKAFTVHGDAGANWVLTNATLAERFAGNTTRMIFSVDLEGYSQVRLRANQQVASASANTPQMLVKYFTSYNTTHTNYLTLGTAGDVSIGLSGVGYKDTGWLDMVAGARVPGVYICFKEIGGDGVADPGFGATDILFR